MDDNYTDRTVLLLGKKKYAKLCSARFLLIGVGGVGSYAAEALVRAGIGSLTLIDGDVVQASNINRQLHALTTTIGQPKVV
ncbi:MAG: ThiF family adenylyltransferase, partial [Desulfobacter sp.]